MGTKWAGGAIIAVAFSLMMASSAQAAVTMTSPGSVDGGSTSVAADGGYTTETDMLAQDADMVDALGVHYHCRTFTTVRERHGLTGGLLWHFQRNKHFCYNGSHVKNVQTDSNNSHGTLTWSWDGIVDSYDTIGCGTGTCSKQGATVKGKFTSTISFFGVTEHNYPTIRQTVYADGSGTSTTTCGC